MSVYKLTVLTQAWRYLDSETLALRVRQLADLSMNFNTERELVSEPKPEVRIVEKIVHVHDCSKCNYTTSSAGGLKTHQRVHK